MKTRSWLHEWIDVEDIESVDEAIEAIQIPQAAERLLAISRKALDTASYSRAEPVPNGAVASGTLDPNSRFSCLDPRCAYEVVEPTLMATWHYFDRVIISEPRFLPRDWEPRDLSPAAKRYVVATVNRLLRIRAIGAESFFGYEPQRFYCEEHFEQHAIDVGIPQVISERDALYEHLVSSGRLERQTLEDGRTRVTFRHPALGAIANSRILKENEADSADAELICRVAQDAVDTVTASIVSDATTAQKLRLPMVSSDGLTGHFLSADVPHQDFESRVAINIDFPMLKGVSASELSRMMVDEREHYQRFRHALRLAVRDKIRGVAEESDPSAIARQVYEDYVEPEVAQLQVRLRTAKRALSRKAALEVAVGSAVASVGVLTGMPLIAGVVPFGLGAIAIGDAVRHAVNFVEQVQDLEEHDMYFLWHAQAEDR